MAKILLVELPGFMALPSHQALASLWDGDDFAVVTSVDAALAALKNQNFSYLVVNAPHYELLSRCHAENSVEKTVLITDLPMHIFSKSLNGEDSQLADHVIANRPSSFWVIQELRVTLAKLRAPDDIFGIAKYLASGTPILSAPITGSKDREKLNQEVLQFALDCKLGQHMAKMAFGITEELLMNTIHDAPQAAGIERHQNADRHAPVLLSPDEFGELNYGFDGRIFALSSKDPFGALSRVKLHQYVQKIVKRKDSEDFIDTKAGGAGLGFFKILYSCHSLVCNVQPGRMTEVIAIIDLTEQLRDFVQMPRSVHYFSFDSSRAALRAG